MTFREIAEVVAAFFLPPLAVFLRKGCNRDFAINVLLTILAFIPGVIHALWIICKGAPV